MNNIMQLVIQNFGRKAIAITAPTEVAAINIGGNTINTQFSIAVKSATLSKLENEPLSKFQNKNTDLKFIIMDEMSMIGARLLHHIESQCFLCQKEYLHHLQQLNKCQNLSVNLQTRDIILLKDELAPPGQ